MLEANDDLAGVTVSSRERKVRAPIIEVEDVGHVFNDEQVERLAKSADLPPGADMATLAKGVREAARIYAGDARTPNANELHDAIEDLYKAAIDHRYDEVAVLLDNLSPRARDLLLDRGAPNIRLRLPSSEALRDPRRLESACERVARLCRIGVERIPGRRRPSGKRSRPVVRTLLQAPEPQRNFSKRDAERDFVMWLRFAYWEATGSMPARTARHADDSRDIGPFARFARDCLRLAGATHADVVDLINELHRDHVDLNARSGGLGPHD
jgi:hypothetical protein